MCVAVAAYSLANNQIKNLNLETQVNLVSTLELADNYCQGDQSNLKCLILAKYPYHRLFKATLSKGLPILILYPAIPNLLKTS